MSLEANGPIEPKGGALSDKLHGNVYEVPDHMKKWFSYKGNKIYANGREQWLRDDVVTWDELQTNQDANKVFYDAYDQSMLNELTEHVYRKRFKPQVPDRVYDESNGASYVVPAPLREWFDQNRRELDNGSESGLDGKVTIDDLSTPSSGMKDSQQLDELQRHLYSQRFKPQGDLKVFNKDGTAYAVPRDLQKWANQNRYNLDTSHDGIITFNEINYSAGRHFDGADDARKLEELQQKLYRQRFNLHGDIPVVSKLYDTPYVLPKDLQQRVNHNAFALDVSDEDGILTDDEITRQSSNDDLKEFIINNPPGVELKKSFIQQVAKDPEKLKTWFEQHKNRLDTNQDGKTSRFEMNDYGIAAKLNANDRTMLVGLHNYADLFASEVTKTDTFITSESIDLAVKLVRHEITPAQIALNSTINPTKIGAALGALGGGAVGLGYTAPLASSAYASWGTLSAGAIGSCAAVTAVGALSGALVGAAAIGGTAYGINYFAAKDWYEKRTKAYRDIGLIK